METPARKGLIHLYCGDGKGKTTAAIGLSVRAVGRGFKVIFAQFLKSMETGEILPLQDIGVTVLRGNIPRGFTWELTEPQKEILIDEHNRLFERAVSLCGDGEDTLLVLDELIGAYAGGYLSREAVLRFLKEKPPALEVILTGRNPAAELTGLSDYVTEMRKLKHPMDKGITARAGIEL